LGSKVNAMVIGSANMISTAGVPKTLGIVIMGVFIASFAGTTLDSATRIQRYVVSELFSGTKLKFMTGRYAATAFAVITAAGLAFGTGANGKGALKLWPLFGAVNQLLAAVGLLLLTIYLKKEQRGWLCWLSGIPFAIMLSITVWAVAINERNFVVSKQWLLAGVNGLLIVLVGWTVVEGIAALASRPSESPLKDQG